MRSELLAVEGTGVEFNDGAAAVGFEEAGTSGGEAGVLDDGVSGRGGIVFGTAGAQTQKYAYGQCNAHHCFHCLFHIASPLF